jgi:hypothetical protein
MEPTCTAADLARLAEECRAEGLAAAVEGETLRVRLLGSCYARPDPGGQILGWTEGNDVLWYGRFDTAADLVRSARSVRRLRWLAKAGLGLIGIWFAHVTASVAVPGYRSLLEDAPLLNALVVLAALFGLGVWLTARIVRWRLIRRARGVVWLRGPLESANRAPR